MNWRELDGRCSSCFLSFACCWFWRNAETGSCQVIVSPASMMSMAPLSIRTEATKRITARMRTQSRGGRVAFAALPHPNEESLTPDMAEQTTAAAPTTNAKLLRWVEEIAELTQPDSVHWCDGSAGEYDALCADLVDAGTFERLSDAKRPNSYLARSDPGDVARVEDRTFICSEREDEAGPNNNWRNPTEMRETLTGLFRGSMRGRTLYVV